MTHIERAKRLIKSVTYSINDKTDTVFCIIKMRSGFSFSTVAYQVKDVEKGKQIAFNKGISKIIEFDAYTEMHNDYIDGIFKGKNTLLPDKPNYEVKDIKENNNG